MLQAVSNSAAQATSGHPAIRDAGCMAGWPSPRLDKVEAPDRDWKAAVSSGGPTASDLAQGGVGHSRQQRRPSKTRRVLPSADGFARQFGVDLVAKGDAET